MLDAAGRMLRAESPEEEPLPVLELSLGGVQVAGVHVEGTNKGANARKRLDWLVRPGHAALLTNYAETFLLSGYLRRFSTEALRFVVGLDAVIMILNDRFYAGINGGVLGALGRLLAPNVKLYVFSMSAELLKKRLARYGVGEAFCRVPEKELLTVADVQLAAPAGHLLDFLREAGGVVEAESHGG